MNEQEEDSHDGGGAEGPGEMKNTLKEKDIHIEFHPEE